MRIPQIVTFSASNTSRDLRTKCAFTPHRFRCGAPEKIIEPGRRGSVAFFCPYQK
ncbi:hypothetical protein HMPREF9440_00964 [Sutterella parvirubra YIT 11816]|uniref:Uncharacterized protein n=1 Tax=Sutterella parvirubra YIT 11816 TaxID=762967 RepID=H3KE03_9BURK|nr:hypothetical protein HMPREF9440_00964 [Sutterella parvirubra YIT 11816]